MLLRVFLDRGRVSEDKESAKKFLTPIQKILFRTPKKKRKKKKIEPLPPDLFWVDPLNKTVLTTKKNID